jgi:NAD(P)-dependent dehydrogenase (short-subunit alcohol dehydrogenase family)
MACGLSGGEAHPTPGNDTETEIHQTLRLYGMVKTAQLAVSRGLAEAVAGTGITFNSIFPGPTKSQGQRPRREPYCGQGQTFEVVGMEFLEKMRLTRGR